MSSLITKGEDCFIWGLPGRYWALPRCAASVARVERTAAKRRDIDPRLFVSCGDGDNSEFTEAGSPSRSV